MDGISHEGELGADAIVLSGGYEDDLDLGDEIIYTGFGGRDANTGAQVKDQEFIKGNLALGVNKMQGLPVRVIRGHTHKSKYSPKSGYSYDGLYYVDDYWHERGRSGFRVWRYRLVKVDRPAKGLDQPSSTGQGTLSPKLPSRMEVTTLQLVRDTKQARQIKQLYNYRCQICGLRIETPASPYAEAAHIRPLGRPHNGSDTQDNLLCLCPNHHVMLDLGVFVVNPDLSLSGIQGRLQEKSGHRIDPANLRYHAEHYKRTR